MGDHIITVGNVLRADIRGFVIASRIPEPDVPTFGAFVRAPIQQEQAALIGQVYDIRLEADPFMRSIAAAVDERDPAYQEVIADQRAVRLLPVEISVIALGYRDIQGRYHGGLPPQPPMLLRRIALCAEEEVRALTETPEFLDRLLESRDVPADDLIRAALRQALALRPGQDGKDYRLSIGRYLAHRLAQDPLRLSVLLQRLEAE